MRVTQRGVCRVCYDRRVLVISSRYIEVAGLRTHYLDAGEGPPLLFLPPSAFLLARSYQHVIRGLARRFHVIAPELPGSGNSAPLEQEWGFREYAAWAAGVLDALVVDRAIVAGHSNGGGVALVMAAMYPDRVERLVLVDSVGVREQPSPVRIVGARVLDGLLEMPLNVRAWPDPVHNIVYHSRSFFRQIRDALTADLTRHAPLVSARTLLAWGEWDHTMPVRDARRLLSLLPPRSSIYLASRGSHDWLVLKPEEFVGAVFHFCEDQEAR
ncbi:MAG: alpha/beta hydrolase [Chloroflexota bacterium]|nr:alpha/beta hydrolase [Chloroflexota bacterium]